MSFVRAFLLIPSHFVLFSCGLTLYFVFLSLPSAFSVSFCIFCHVSHLLDFLCHIVFFIYVVREIEFHTGISQSGKKAASEEEFFSENIGCPTSGVA
jgi:hypothetical protein